MAGLHGKNAELRIGTTETAVASEFLTAHSDVGLAARGVFQSANQNWKFVPRGLPGAIEVTYESPTGTQHQIDANSRFVHYADGSVRIPAEHFALLDDTTVEASYTYVTMHTVANLTNEDRNYTLNIESPVIDTTVLNENFTTYVEGIQAWNGDLDGLYINPDRYKLALATASGIIPRKILRLRPNPASPLTYYQGQVIFNTWELSGGYDSAIERSVEFSGNGPIDLMEDGLPFFQAD